MNLDTYLKKVPTWLGVLSLLGVTFGIVKYVVNAETSGIRTDIGTLKTDVATIKDRLDKNEAADSKTNQRIDELLSKAFDKVVPSVVAKPTRSQLEKANAVVVMAQTAGVKLNVLTLARYGTLIAHASANPATADIAWPSLKQAVDYRSFLNKDYVPVPKDLTECAPGGYGPSVTLSGEIEGRDKSKPAVKILCAGRRVGPETSAKLETLANPQPVSSGVGLFVIEDGHMMISLDGMNMKNVIIRNTVVSYSGSLPVRLENVAFVNCQFILTKSKHAIGLGEAILQANSVHYSTVTPA
jgi:hypothetical protein